MSSEQSKESVTSSKQRDVGLLQDPVAQQLLQSKSLAHLAYNWHDGTPRVIPIGFVYSTRTQARQEDIVLGEGQAMVFTPLERVLDLDLIPTIRLIVERFLEQANQ